MSDAVCDPPSGVADDAPDGWTRPHPACETPPLGAAFDPTFPRALLATLVATPSVSGDERAVAERLVATFERAGREAWIDEAGNVRAPADDTALLTGHLDTVPGAVPVEIERVASEQAAWGGAPIGDRPVTVLSGRGSVDATGALTVAAVAALACGVSFAGVTREETDSAGARHLVRDRQQPGAVVNGEPSGWDGLTFAYRGLVRGTYTVRVPASHGARPEPTAVDHATAWWERVRETVAADGPVVDRVTATPTAVEGGRTTDGTATTARLEATFRVPLGGSPAEVRSLIDDCTERGSIEWTASIPPVETSPRGQVPRAFRAAIRAAGGEPRALRKTGTADTNHYAARWDCPVVTYGPGDASLDHTPEERLPLPAFDRAIAVCRRAVEQLSE